MAGRTLHHDGAGHRRARPGPPHVEVPWPGAPFPWPTLTLVLALVCPAAAPAVDILRLRPSADGATPVSLVADEVYTWTEGTEQVFVLGGGVWVQQDQTEVNAPRAVVWVDVNAVKRREPVRVAVYAAEGDSKKARVRTRGRAEQEAEAVVLEFTSPAFGRLRGKVHEESMAHSGLYQRARAARGAPRSRPRRATRRRPPARPGSPGHARDPRRAIRPDGHRPDRPAGAHRRDPPVLALPADQPAVQRLPRADRVEGGEGVGGDRRDQAGRPLRHGVDSLPGDGGRPGCHLAAGGGRAPPTSTT